MKSRVLFVDDEPILLDTMARLLRSTFDVTTAEGGVAGLARIREEGAFAVVVSDLRMPGMDGIAFLTRVRELAPETVRVMLTGAGDLGAAVKAVNEGQIFRFLNKPCDVELLESTLRACEEQYRLLRAERELLEDTLAGSIRVMTEILGVVNPGAFGRAARLRRYMGHMARALRCNAVWQYELAGMLSMIGCVAVPTEILDKAWVGQPLDADEARILDSHPELGRALLKHIPRLEPVAEIIARQVAESARPDVPGTAELGGAMLRTALELDRLLTRGETMAAAIASLGRRPERFPGPLVAALQDLPMTAGGMVARSCRVDELDTGMVLDQDARTAAGMLLAAKGHELTPALVQRLRNFARGVGVAQPIRVLIPSVPPDRAAA